MDAGDERHRSGHDRPCRSPTASSPQLRRRPRCRSVDALFTDDATLGGSFTYDVVRRHRATSGNAATATVINNATIATTLTGTGGDDIIIATNGTETLSGGGGNDILIGNSGSHVMTGGSGNDTFAFLQTSDGPSIITDFNNTYRARPYRDFRRAVSAAG